MSSFSIPLVTAYEETGSKTRSHGFAAGYQNSTSRRYDSRRDHSPSPLRDRSPRRRSPLSK